MSSRWRKPFTLIDEECAIYLKGKGFCWCPSDSWGLADHVVCKLCQIKNSQIVEKIGPFSPEKPKVFAVTSNREIGACSFCKP